jgi:signal recognition particle GTPase
LLNFVEKFSISENNNLYESIKIKNNRKNFLNKMMKNIMKIIFTKKRINENQKIIEDFKKIIIEIDLTSELIEIITKQIENIIENSLGIHKNKSHENKKKENKGQEIKKDDNYNNISLSNFYEVIFNLILYILFIRRKNFRFITTNSTFGKK